MLFVFCLKSKSYAYYDISACWIASNSEMISTIRDLKSLTHAKHNYYSVKKGQREWEAKWKRSREDLKNVFLATSTGELAIHHSVRRAGVERQLG